MTVDASKPTLREYSRADIDQFGAADKLDSRTAAKVRKFLEDKRKTMKGTHAVRDVNTRSEASRRLGELLEEVHAQLPAVDGEAADRLITDEVTKVRAARRKHMNARPTRAQSRQSQKQRVK